MILKNGLTYQTIVKIIKDHFQEVWTMKKNGLFNDELGGKIMIEFVALRVKTYSYSMYDGSEKKAKRTKKYATEIETKLNDYKYIKQ